MDDNQLTQSAITAALNRDWKQSVTLNLKILKKNSKDIDALNRLGRAYFESGLKTKAQQTYTKVLRHDKFNSIALKNLNLIKSSRLTPSSKKKVAPSTPPPEFLEEPGITKTVSLIRLGDTKYISRLHPGDSLSLAARPHCVSVVTSDNQYVGRLPDDLAFRLIPLLKAGNKYHSWIKSLTDGVKIFIKEAYRHPRFAHTPSFPATERLTYAAFTPPELVHDEKPDVSETEDVENTSSSDVSSDDFS